MAEVVSQVQCIVVFDVGDLLALIVIDIGKESFESCPGEQNCMPGILLAQ